MGGLGSGSKRNIDLPSHMYRHEEHILIHITKCVKNNISSIIILLHIFHHIHIHITNGAYKNHFLNLLHCSILYKPDLPLGQKAKIAGFSNCFHDYTISLYIHY